MVSAQRCCLAAVLVLQVSAARLVEELKKDSMEAGLVQLKTQDFHPPRNCNQTWFKDFTSNVHGCPQELPNFCGTKRFPVCQVLLDVPDQCVGTDGAKCAAIFAFHGAGTPALATATSRIGKVIRDKKLNMFGVFPQGATMHWNTAGDVEDEDEDAFIGGIIDALRAMGWKGRAYAHGTSNGAALVQLLSVNNRFGFAGAAPASTQLTREPSTFKWPQGWKTHPDPSTRPIPMMAFHGTSDRIAHYDGGKFTINGSIKLYSVDESNRKWQLTNGCGVSPKSKRTFEQHGATLHEYKYSCPVSSPFTFYIVENGQHTAFLDLECQHLMLDFFASLETMYESTSAH